MGWFRHLRARIRYRSFQRDVAQEIEVHRAMKRDALEAAGHSRASARRQAARDLGNLATAREDARAVWIAPWIQSVAQDVRYAARVLARERWFTATAVLALAVGIAGVSMMFTIINGYFLRGLPARDGGRLMLVGVSNREGRPDRLSPFEFDESRRVSRSFTAMAAFRAIEMTVIDPGVAPDRVGGAYVSAGLFEMLGEQPLLGRSIQPADDRAGAPPVVVLAHRLWTGRYDASPAIVGHTIVVNGSPATVVGVMPEGFGFPFNEALWQPLAAMPGMANAAPDDRMLNVIGRLADGVSVPQVRAELMAVAAGLAARFPQTHAGFEPALARFGDQYHGRLRDAPEPLLGAMLAGLLLLVACVNVANLLLARSAGRAREVAIRTAVGATRRRIVRQLFVEAVLLASVAGAAGLWLSTFGVAFQRSLMGTNLPYWMEFTIDIRVVSVLVVVCFVTSLVAGLVPALVASRTDVSGVMKEDARAGGGRRTGRWTAGLLVAECALTVVLLAASVLVLRAFLALVDQDRIIDASRVLTTSVALPEDRYTTADERRAVYTTLEARLAATPGIGVATLASARPFAGGTRMTMAIEGRAEPTTADRPMLTLAVGPRYFQALGLGSLSGRTFTEADGVSGEPVALVNQLFADTYFAGERVLGRRLRLSLKDADPAASPWLTVVGIVPTIRQNIASGASPVVYTPFRQYAERTAHLVVGGLNIPAAATPELRRAAASVDPDLAIFNVRPLTALRTDSRLPQLLISTIFSIFAVAGLLLAVVGVYSVTAYAARQRLHEIAVRLVLGAGTREIVWLLLERAVVTLTVGLALGSIGAFAAGRFLRAVLVGISPADATTFVAVVALLSAVTLAASLVPSLRASRLDPNAILRRE